jgi:hypothetical protein
MSMFSCIYVIAAAADIVFSINKDITYFLEFLHEKQ